MSGWDAATSTLALLLPALYPIQASDTVVIRPGCKAAPGDPADANPAEQRFNPLAELLLQLLAPARRGALLEFGPGEHFVDRGTKRGMK